MSATLRGPSYYDKVQETSTTTGTGTLTLAGAVIGFQAFSAVVQDGQSVYYHITDGTNWETGRGSYALGATTLTRDVVEESSNSNALVSFSAGTKYVSIVQPAAHIADIAMTAAFTMRMVPQ